MPADTLISRGDHEPAKRKDESQRDHNYRNVEYSIEGNFHDYQSSLFVSTHHLTIWADNFNRSSRFVIECPKCLFEITLNCFDLLRHLEMTTVITQEKPKDCENKKPKHYHSIINPIVIIECIIVHCRN